ncbi:hypothetical protein [Eubacterium sp.]
MKKFISIALSAIMLISAGAISAMPVMAAVSSPGSSEVTTKPAVDTEPVVITVNSGKSSDVTYTKEDYKYTFSYSGKGEVIDWEFPNMVEGVDFSVLSMSDDNSKIVIELTESGKQKQLVANAVVKNSTASKEDGEVDENDAASKDNSNTSPATGAAMAGIAMAGTGVALLAISKKKKD